MNLRSAHLRQEYEGIVQVAGLVFDAGRFSHGTTGDTIYIYIYISLSLSFNIHTYTYAIYILCVRVYMVYLYMHHLNTGNIYHMSRLTQSPLVS